jgi:hypothetical protein
MRQLVYFLTIALTFSSCKKGSIEAGKTVEMYLLKSYQTVTGKCQIDASASILQDTALVRNQDILEYFKASTQFALSDNCLQKIKALADKTPLAVVVDKQLIYFAILKPLYSSSSCPNSITMDYVGTGNKVSMKLGYAGAEINIDDQRNNPKLLATLKKQGKLR